MRKDAINKQNVRSTSGEPIRHLAYSIISLKNLKRREMGDRRRSLTLKKKEVVDIHEFQKTGVFD